MQPRLLVGVDDTDSRLGGCTTALAAGLITLFPELTPSGAPRLVRLNPNVPWKTRGNGALALAFEGTLDLDVALSRVAQFVEVHARRDEGTSPGFVVATRAPDASLYEAAVTRIVERAEVEAALASVGARWQGGRGVIGAAAALAWPAKRSTWERIAYREDARIGTPRAIDAASIREAECAHPSLFDSYDFVEEEVVCVPASPCPVLWGLRGTDPDALRDAASLLGPERPARETLFLTNHGSDDHLRDANANEARAYASLRIRARVATLPREHGGHVFVDIEDHTGVLRCAAYAPTRSFRHLIAALRPGDDVTVAGGIHAGPDARLTLGLEKLALHDAAPRKLANPTCPSCARAMKSAGRGAGYRCRTCGTRAKAPQTVPADLPLGWHEVPSCARRHLARPLRLTAAVISRGARGGDAECAEGKSDWSDRFREPPLHLRVLRGK